jgi:Zn-dependent protease with chaperone function
MNTYSETIRKNSTCLAHYYDKSDVHWPMVFPFLFLFVLLFFSLWVSDKEKSTSVTFSAYTYGVITLNEQILSLSLSILLASIQTHVKTTMRYVCITYRWTNDEKQEKRIRRTDRKLNAYIQNRWLCVNKQICIA